MLVNLTCGRNPWKRASTEDSTFQAYLKDPFFLKSILPLSTEMVCILSRVFERDPTKRITIPELRQAILECPCFTENSMAQSWVPEQLDYIPQPFMFDMDHIEPLHAQTSGSSSDSQYSAFSETASDATALTEDYSDLNSMSPVASEYVPNCKMSAFGEPFYGNAPMYYGPPFYTSPSPI